MNYQKTIHQKVNNMRYIPLLVAITIVSSFATNAQKEITLQEARQKVLTAPEIKQAELNLKIQRLNRHLDYDFGMTEATYSNDKEKALPDNQKIAITQKDMDLLSIFAKRSLSHEMVELSSLQRDFVTTTMIKNISEAWIANYCRGQIYHIYEEINDSFKNILRAAQIRYKAEETSKLDLLATQNEGYRLKIEMQEALADYKQTEIDLNKWFEEGSKYQASLISSEQLISSLPPIPKDLGQSIILDIAQKGSSVEEAKWKVMKSGFFPKINMGYNKAIGNHTNGAYGFEIGISIPLPFNGTITEAKKAKIQKEHAKLEAQKVSRDTKSTYASLYTDYLKWQKTWQYYQENALPLAQEQHKGAIKAYEEGGIDYITFLQNIRDALKLEVEAWLTFESYLKCYYTLEYLITTNSKNEF
ncbi:TolC family protein [Falsiporphyromonas endometrii]